MFAGCFCPRRVKRRPHRRHPQTEDPLMLRRFSLVGAMAVAVGLLTTLDVSAQKGGGGGHGGGGHGGGGGGGRSSGGFHSGGASFHAAPSGVRSQSISPGAFTVRSAPATFNSPGVRFASPNHSTWNGTHSSFNNNWSNHSYFNNNWNWRGDHFRHHNSFWPYFAFGLFGNGFGYPFGWNPWYYGYGPYVGSGYYADNADYYYRSYPPLANADLNLMTPLTVTAGSATIEALLPNP